MIDPIARDYGSGNQPVVVLHGAAAVGDLELFGSEAGVEAPWRIVDPILKCDEPPYEYKPGSWGPAEAGRITT